MRPHRIALTALLLLTVVLVASAPVAAKPTCVSNGSMDYETFTCVDPSDPKCPVYTITASDRDGVQKNCLTHL